MKLNDKKLFFLLLLATFCILPIQKIKAQQDGMGEVIPNAGGPLPELPTIEGLAPNKIGGFTIQRIYYSYYTFNSDVIMSPRVVMRFPPPSTLGADSYTLQSYDLNNQTWNNVLNDQNEITTTTVDNFWIKFFQTTKYRLLVNGGEKNGYTSNEEIVQLPVAATTWNGNSFDMGWHLGDAMFPNVGCAFLAQASVSKYNSTNKKFEQVNDTLNFVYEWYRRNPNNYSMYKITSATTNYYKSTYNDVGYEIVSVIKGDGAILDFHIEQTAGLPIRFSNRSAFEYLSDDGFIINMHHSVPNFQKNTLQIGTYENLIEIDKVEEIKPGKYKVFTTLPKGYYTISSSSGKWAPSSSWGEELALFIDSHQLTSEISSNDMKVNGKIELLQKKIDGSVESINTLNADAKKVTFDVITGQYILRALQTDTTLVTYFPEAILWSDASNIKLPIPDFYDDTTFTIKVQKKPILQATASGVIEGVVILSTNPSLSNRLNIAVKSDGSIFNLYLVDKSTKLVIAATQTDNTGKYRFEKIPIGEYEILVDYPGAEMVSVHTIEITSNNSVVTEVDYEISDNVIKIVSRPTIIATKLYNGINISPNPAKDFIVISNTEQLKRIIIISANGSQLVLQNKLSNTLDVSQLKNGLYIIKVFTNNNEYIGKFIKD